MRSYVKPSFALVKLTAEEHFACTGSIVRPPDGSCSGTGGHIQLPIPIFPIGGWPWGSGGHHGGGGHGGHR